MDWGSIGGAALAGGLGGLVGGALGAVGSRLFPEGHRKAVTMAFVIICAVIAPRIAEPVFEQRVTAATMEAELLASAEFGALSRAWKNADERSFTAAMEQMAVAVRSGTPHEDAVNTVRATMLSAAIPRFAYLDDQRNVEIALISRDEYAELSRSHPQVCHPMFNGAPFGDVTPYLSDAVRAREMALLQAAFEADASVAQNALRGAEMTAAIEQVLKETRARVGEDVDLLAPNAALAGRESRYCRVISEFFGIVSALPPAEAAALLRGMRSHT